jgi:hypothetical protein
MKRAFFFLLVGAALLAGIPAQAFWQSRDSNYNIAIASGATYTGPGDIVSGATAFYGLRAYNAAYAATPGLAVNVRRASDNVACDVNVATTGGFGLTTATCNSSTQGGITPSAFAGTDATATCTLATTTATCTGASSTPHVGSTITGASLTQPCLITAVGTFTAGAGTLTTSLAGTSTSCGTISVGETFTMTYGLFVTKAYDQSGNGNHVSQSTAANQPQLLPFAFNSGTLPALLGSRSNPVQLLGNIPSLNQPYSMTAVAQNIGGNTSEYTYMVTGTSATAFGSCIEIFSNNFSMAAASRVNIAAADGNPHAIQGIFNGSSSIGLVDGNVTSSLSPGTGTTGTFIEIMGRGPSGQSMSGYFVETGLWPSGFSSAQYGGLHSNMSTYWGTP